MKRLLGYVTVSAVMLVVTTPPVSGVDSISQSGTALELLEKGTISNPPDSPVKPSISGDPSILPNGMAEQWRAKYGLSLKDSELMWASSGVLYDLQEKFKTNPKFGSAFSSPTGSFRMYVRFEESDEIEAEVQKIELKWGVEVKRLSGGLSYADSERFKRDLTPFGDRAFSTETDPKFGTVTVKTADKDVIAFTEARALESPGLLVQIDEPLPVKDVAFPGGTLWQVNPASGNWASVCSYGGVFRPYNGNVKTVVTAGHCDFNGVGSTNGGDTFGPSNGWGGNSEDLHSSRWEQCSTYADIQFHDYVNSTTAFVSNFVPIGWPNQSTWYPVKEIALGANYGMPTYTIGGRSRRDGLYTNTGIFSAFEWTPNPLGGFCGGSFYGPMMINGQALEGDSGGAMVNIYNGQFYLLGITKAVGYISGVPFTNATMVNWIFGTGSMNWWCSQTNPCY